jgi:hypothetical protein
MNLKASQLGNLESFVQQSTHVLEMIQHGLGALVALAAMDLVSIKTEPVVKTLGLATGLLDELFTQRFEGLQLTLVNLKIGNDRTARILCGHELLLAGRIVMYVS